ncbi:Release factor glutamine methyltransferase [Paenibacillus plantiphilus]|uniref:Release factor glutamine methyltransferase n=1 Tax=Paenibacillus plantiphilus TaxID=2905650 RepID=A0ABN8G0N5_9BACL|nr:HemK/PrmC family methyltransferase [Paenibacillus plantiphilus]CAH1193467.1 Release factor glutamine methyltransferase [Paenibacillus plantiphilus]
MERMLNGDGIGGDGSPDRQPLTIGEACVQASLFLEGSGVGEPRANAERLLMHLLRLERAELLRDWRDEFPADLEAEWERLLERKADGEPVQYITGEQWFYGLPFAVTPAVLIPRPETELLVEAVIAAADLLWPEAATSEGESRCGRVDESGNDMRGGDSSESVGDIAESDGESGNGMRGGDGVERDGDVFDGGAGARRAPLGVCVPTVVDVGTGSGAIGVTLAVQRPLWRVCASDLSPDALAVARTNAASHEAAARMAFVQGDLLAPFAERRECGAAAAGAEGPAGLRIDVLVSNPPYIPAGDIAGLQREVREHEPRLALDGGADGLAPYRSMIAQLSQLAVMPRIVAFELGLGQAEAVAEMLRACGVWRDIRIIRDYAGIERHVLAVDL